jgi:CheY-like chemotaxis protein
MSEAISNGPRLSLWNKDGPLRVLLIENSEEDASLNLHALERAGFLCQPSTISTREELLGLFPRFAYDVVLADYRLPSWTGMDAFTAIREAGAIFPSSW